MDWDPPSGNWVNLDGVVQTDPVAITSGRDRLDVFIRGMDAAIWHKGWNGTAWSGFESLGGEFVSKPAAVSWAANRLDTVARKADGTIWHKARQGSWQPSQETWVPLGGSADGDPAIVSGAANRLDVFARSRGGGVLHKAWDGSQWVPAGDGWDNLGGSTIGSPAAVARGDRLDIFIRSTTGNLLHKALIGRTAQPAGDVWEDLGGPVSSDASVVSWGPARLDLFARGMDGAVWHKALDGSSWSPSLTGWAPLGGRIEGAPAAASWGPNRLDVVGRSPDGSVIQKAWNGSGWQPSQTEWSNRGGALDGLPSIVAWGPNRLDIVGRGRTPIVLTDVSPVHSRRWGPDGRPSDWMGAMDQHGKGRSSAAGLVSSLAISRDGRRAYAGGSLTGLWRSDDGGIHWRQMRSPQSGDGPPACRPGGDVPCSLPMGMISDIAVWPGDPDLVFVALSLDARSQLREGVYRSEDGGATWTRAFQFDATACGDGARTVRNVGQVLFAPDDSTKIWAAGGCGIAFSTLGGAPPAANVAVIAPGLIHSVGARGSWRMGRSAAGSVWHIAVGRSESAGTRKVLACGPGTIWYSRDGGLGFSGDTNAGAIGGTCQEPANRALQQLAASSIVLVAGTPAKAYVAVLGGSTGPAFFFAPGFSCTGGCVEASLKSATINDSGPPFAWRPEASPPVYMNAGANSGSPFVAATGSGGLIFVDKDTVHISQSAPRMGGWHRLDAPDIGSLCATASSPNCNASQMSPHDIWGEIHMDPHVIAFTPGFDVALSPYPDSTPSTYNVTSRLSRCAPGQAILLANDGGVYRSEDCGVSWTRSEDLKTLFTTELAGAAVPGTSPSLYFGMPDNDSLYSADGGQTWRVGDECGDCGGYWADPLAPATIMHVYRYPDDPTTQRWFGTWDSITPFPPNLRGGGPCTWVQLPNGPPDTGTGQPCAYFPLTATSGPGPSVSYVSYHGSRPTVFTLPSELPWTGGGDFVFPAQDPDGSTRVWRSRTGPGSGGRNMRPASPALGVPLRYPVVQASGGHGGTIYYLADLQSGESPPVRLWRSRDDGRGWDCIVPGSVNLAVPDGRCLPDPTSSGAMPCPEGRACRAFSFASDPYHPNIVYIADYDGIKLSTDGGRTWALDTSLNRWLRDSGTIPSGCREGFCLWSQTIKSLLGMTFVPGEPRTRFAVGVAGVFYTTDGAMARGETGAWHRLLDSDALACLAWPPYFDAVGSPSRSLYIPCAGRSLLRAGPIPAPGSPAAAVVIDATDSVVLGETRGPYQLPPGYDPTLHFGRPLSDDELRKRR